MSNCATKETTKRRVYRMICSKSIGQILGKVCRYIQKAYKLWALLLIYHFAYYVLLEKYQELLSSHRWYWCRSLMRSSSLFWQGSLVIEYGGFRFFLYDFLLSLFVPSNTERKGRAAWPCLFHIETLLYLFKCFILVGWTIPLIYWEIVRTRMICASHICSTYQRSNLSDQFIWKLPLMTFIRCHLKLPC